MIQNLVKHRSILISSIVIFLLMITVSLSLYFANNNIDNAGNLNSSAKGAIIETNFGILEISFLKEAAPLSVNSFIKLTKAGLYNGVRMSDMVNDFIQFSAPTSTMEVSWNEVNNEHMTFGSLGTVTGEKSGGFFIVTGYAAPWLEGEHAVFARVTNGLDILSAMAKAPKNNRGGLITPVVIKSVTLK
ncbi:MAG: peptidylprolyl isomerase [Minisyncoccia bacterium]